MVANETVTKPSVMSVGLKYGLIMGLISIVYSLIKVAVGANPMDNGWVSNVALLVIVVSVVVLAQKNFKDSGDGFMTYGQGLGVAMVATIVSVVVSGIYTFIYLNFI